MDTIERARKIANEISTPKNYERVYTLIATQLREVEMAAREKAAGIADVNDGICDGGDHTTHKVAERIREMNP